MGVNLLSLVEVDDSFEACVDRAARHRGQFSEYPASALANRFPRAPAARSITA